MRCADERRNIEPSLVRSDTAPEATCCVEIDRPCDAVASVFASDAELTVNLALVIDASGLECNSVESDER